MSLHHSFDIELAAEFSIEESILIHHFLHWIRINRDLKRNLIENKTWTYQTLEEIAAHFPYFSKKQVERIINKLVKKSVIIKGNFNKNKYDHTVWYAFVNEGKFLPFIEISRNREIEKTVSGNRNPQIGTPIPDSITDTKTKEEHPPNPPEGGRVRVACGAFVKLTEEEREALEEAYGYSRVQELIDEINDYLASTGKKPYKDFAAAIRQWARRRGYVKAEKPKEEILKGFEEKKPIKREYTREQQDQMWFANLESDRNLCKSGRFTAFKICGYLQSELRLDSSSRGINFLDLPEAKFYYGEPGFKDKVDSALRKLDIVVKS